MKFTRYDPPYASYNRWTGISLEGNYHVVKPDALTGLMPDTLLNKTNSVVVLASASGQFSVYVANLNRVDFPDNAVDQHPYIAVFDHSVSAASGGFVDHGDWDGRTDYPGNNFFDAISASGITAHYPLEQMPNSTSGTLDELNTSSQKAAFWQAFSALHESDD